MTNEITIKITNVCRGEYIIRLYKCIYFCIYYVWSQIHDSNITLQKFAIDGTFKNFPSNFSQICTINADYTIEFIKYINKNMIYTTLNYNYYIQVTLED
jgi:hypothetical protein